MFSQGYLTDTQLCIAALWLFYFAVLHRRINLAAARIYLLSLFPVGMLLPLLRIPLLPAIGTPAEAFQMIEIDTLPTELPAMEQTPELSSGQILTYIYLAGVAIVLLLTTTGIVRTWLRTRQATGRIVFSPKVAGAYSVFGTIFINNKYEGSPLLGQILAHEQSHIDHHHTADLIWLNLWRSLLWFNPLAWHSVKLLREVHEFQADQAVIRSGNPAGPYIELLIGTEAGIYPGTANTLCYSLTKKRLNMIAQTAHGRNRNGYLRIALLLPVTGLLLGAFSLTAKAAETTPNLTPQQVAPTETLPADTIHEMTVQVTPILDTLNLQVTPQPKTDVKTKEIHYLDLDVQPDTAKRNPQLITIRGNSDPTKQPIFVIDGVISDTNPLQSNEINANNYTSVTVLKGSAATTAYGDRGKNGAIVITTQKTYSGTYHAQTLSAEDIRLAHLKHTLTADSAIRKRRAQNQTTPRRSVLITQDSQNGPTTSRLVINNGRIIMNPESDQAISSQSGQTITVKLSKREKKRGITVNSKLLKEYPELFYTTDDGSVTNREPVSVYIYDEE